MANVLPPAHIEHPGWCILTVCTAPAGGFHYSRVKIVPEQAATVAGRLVLVDLIQATDGPPLVRLSESDGQHVLRLSLDAAGILAAALRDFTRLGRRAEQ